MLIAALALFLTLPDPMPLTFVHGDEQVVDWLDRASVQRNGDRVRLRMLRIRHSDQAFWVVKEIDCVAQTWALVETKTAGEGDDTPPPVEGDAHHYRIRRDDRAGHALRDAVCDGEFTDAPVAPAPDVATAIARLDETKAAAVRARPLELITVREGGAHVFMDRATLEGGGPQWEVRSLTMTGERGVWSGWMIDCTRSDLALDLQWNAPLVDGAYGTVVRDEDYGGKPAADADQAALVDVACDPRVWDFPVRDSIAVAVRAARANPG